jgi:hypothetical protein
MRPVAGTWPVNDTWERLIRSDISYGDPVTGFVGPNTPEEAALLGWADTPGARPRVVRVEHKDENTAVVIIDTDPHHLEYVQCVRGTDGRWREQISGGY